MYGDFSADIGTGGTGKASLHRVWQVDPPEFSNGYLPAVGTLLNGHHQALLGHRSMGDIVGNAVSVGFLSLVLPQVSVCLLICRLLFVAVSAPFPLLPP